MLYYVVYLRKKFTLKKGINKNVLAPVSALAGGMKKPSITFEQFVKCVRCSHVFSDSGNLAPNITGQGHATMHVHVTTSGMNSFCAWQG